VEIAVRALSPGINDPFTAMNCIDQIAASLTQLMERSIPTGYNYDDGGTLRLVTKPLTFSDIIEAGFNQIRRNGAGDASVNIKLLETIEMLAPHTKTREQPRVLREQAEIIFESCKENLRWDIKYVEEAYHAAISSLEA